MLLNIYLIYYTAVLGPGHTPLNILVNYLTYRPSYTSIHQYIYISIHLYTFTFIHFVSDENTFQLLVSIFYLSCRSWEWRFRHIYGPISVYSPNKYRNTVSMSSVKLLFDFDILVEGRLLLTT